MYAVRSAPRRQARTPRSHDGEAQCVCTAANGNRVARAAEGRKCLLEFLDHGSTDEGSREQSSTKHLGEFLLELQVRSNQIEKGNCC